MSENTSKQFDPEMIVPLERLVDATREFLTAIGLPEVSMRPKTRPCTMFRYGHPTGDQRLERVEPLFDSGFPVMERVDVIRQYNINEDNDEEDDDDDDLGSQYPKTAIIDVSSLHLVKPTQPFKTLEAFLVNGPAITRRVHVKRYILEYPSTSTISEFLEEMESVRTVKKVLQAGDTKHVVTGGDGTGGWAGEQEGAGTEERTEQQEGEKASPLLTPGIIPTVKVQERTVAFSEVLDVLGIYPVYLLRMAEAPSYYTFSDECIKTMACIDTTRVDRSKAQAIHSFTHEILEGRTFLRINDLVFDTTACGWFIDKHHFSGGEGA